MASTADQLSALAQDANFQARVRALAIQEAGVVYSEDPATANHATRLAFAKAVLAGGGPVFATFIVNRTNLIGGTTTYDFTTSHVKTDVTDAAISSQLASDWNILSGV